MICIEILIEFVQMGMKKKFDFFGFLSFSLFTTIPSHQQHIPSTARQIFQFFETYVRNAHIVLIHCHIAICRVSVSTFVSRAISQKTSFHFDRCVTISISHSKLLLFHISSIWVLFLFLFLFTLCTCTCLFTNGMG